VHIEGVAGHDNSMAVLSVPVYNVDMVMLPPGIDFTIIENRAGLLVGGVYFQ